MRRLVVGLAAGLLLLGGRGIAFANDDAVVADAATIRDFLIQNVCRDAAGTVLIGHSPADKDPACIAQRDLRPGERLPYHKHDHPSPAQAAELPLGYQRHDSFPVETAGFGDVVEHSFDFGAGDGRRFGVFDTGTDGGDIAILSPGIVSIGATEDGGAGFQLFVGECAGAVTAAALRHSWLVVQYDPARPAPLQGETVARLNDLKAGRQATCPSRFNTAYTDWRVAPFRYRAGQGQGTPITLTTLISEHYGGSSGRATTDHVERFYFTRELGGTRWERWQNADGNVIASAAKIAEMAAAFAATGRCSTPDMPGGGATMLLIDCREWTQIVPPGDPAGDRAGFFLDAVRARPNVPAFFAAPTARK
ncbi:MAG TPA: hypothetical protein VHW90_07050 [Stellaceae bacterium]|nr:hypothetical protein [Stellaceae bacterium]